MKQLITAELGSSEWITDLKKLTELKKPEHLSQKLIEVLRTLRLVLTWR